MAYSVVAFVYWDWLCFVFLDVACTYKGLYCGFGRNLRVTRRFQQQLLKSIIICRQKNWGGLSGTSCILVSFKCHSFIYFIVHTSTIEDKGFS